MTTPFRFVHCADLHLDAPFPRRSEAVRRRLADGARQALTGLVDRCLSQRVHALIVAGDLFDDERLTPADEQLLLTEMTRLTEGGVTVVVSHGHSDPGHAAGRAASMRWPAERFHRLSAERAEEIVVRDADGEVVGRVIGKSLASGQEPDARLADYPEPSGPEPAVGVVHGSILEGGKGGADDAAPRATARLTELGEKGYRYWALGRSHRRRRVLERPLAWYAGPLMGHGFAEPGPCGALVVSVPATGAPKVAFERFAPVAWQTLRLDALTGCEDISAVAVAARDALAKAAPATDTHAAGPLKTVLRLELDGPCPAAPALRTEAGRDELVRALTDGDDVLDVDILVDGLSSVVDLDAHADQPHLLGLSLDVLDEALADDALLDRLAPPVLAGCVGGSPAARREYMRTLLAGLDRQAAELLLRTETEA